MVSLQRKVHSCHHSLPTHILRSEAFEEAGYSFIPRPRFALLLYRVGDKNVRYEITRFSMAADVRETGWRKLPRTTIAFSNFLIALEAWTYKRLEMSRKGFNMLGEISERFPFSL